MILSILLAVLLLLFFFLLRRLRRVSPIRRAGEQGEQIAGEKIRSALRRDDLLFQNVTITAAGKEAELDNVVVNKNGVFIIEVKSYRGTLYGRTEDFEWQQEKATGAGNVYSKPVKNPIKQVNRQVYVLSQYLRSHGLDIWVEGYVMLVYNNSPVRSPAVLRGTRDVSAAVHRRGRTTLTQKQIAQIKRLLG